MRYSAAAAAVFVLILAAALSCGDSAERIMEPRADGSQGYSGGSPGDAQICHENMETLAQGIAMYFGMHNKYPDSIEELAEIDPEIYSLECPSCSLGYIYSREASRYILTCPLPEEPNHGTIINGWSSWPPDPPQWPSVCHDNMLFMASACAMYYGNYNIYPEGIADLVAEGYLPVEPECPACGEPYSYSTDTLRTYTIQCPLPSDPNHGYVIDGVSYWPPDTTGSQDGCRSNMTSLASGMAMFYGAYNRYPEGLKELGTSGMMENWDIPCPACGEMYLYWTEEDGQIYTVQCPLPEDPGHGFVYDGMVSWE